MWRETIPSGWCSNGKRTVWKLAVKSWYNKVAVITYGPYLSALEISTIKRYIHSPSLLSLHFTISQRNVTFIFFPSRFLFAVARCILQCQMERLTVFSHSVGQYSDGTHFWYCWRVKTRTTSITHQTTDLALAAAFVVVRPPLVLRPLYHISLASCERRRKYRNRLTALDIPGLQGHQCYLN